MAEIPILSVDTLPGGPLRRRDGSGGALRFAVGTSWLGALLLAASDTGLCAILLGDDPAALMRDLRARFPGVALIDGTADLAERLATVVRFVDRPALGLDLPLDARGTAFQERVWQALRRVPAGCTVSYTDLAHAVGAPGAVRAVAGVCGANPLAVAIPCHRIVRRDGALSGYRWGVERKRALLDREAAQAGAMRDGRMAGFSPDGPGGPVPDGRHPGGSRGPAGTWGLAPDLRREDERLVSAGPPLGQARLI